MSGCEKKFNFILISFLFFSLFFILPQIVLASPNFEGDHKWAWGENTGWKNFQPTNGGVEVSNGGLTGYLWAENIGWIKLDYDGNPGAENTTATNWGVVNDGNGNLSGYAWGENVGWINFHPTHSQVVIDDSGNFSGYAWAENVGWINFNHSQTNYTPKTSWRPSLTPTEPTSLFCEGQTNPTNITDATPEFSAIYHDPQLNDIANKYRIQVNTASDFNGTMMWDSGASGTSMTNCTQGNRCADISYIGDDLLMGVTYYWRIKFWDAEGNEGLWSTESASFSLLNSDFSGDTKWVWGENTGWKNFRPTNGGVTVYDYGLVGYVWGENIGWVNLDYDGIPGADNTSATNWGVLNDGYGNLSGYAWGENIGWVNFHPSNSQVTIDSSGNFAGYAWGENIGWVKFDHDQTSYIAKTNWRPGTMPVITSIADSPDPQRGGLNITFTASGASDPQNDNIYLYICSNPSYTKCDPANPSYWYISPAGPFSSPYLSVTATKACTSCTYSASNNYWARICDVSNNCSRIVSGGSFTCKKENGCSCSCENGGCTECYGGFCCNSACDTEQAPTITSVSDSPDPQGGGSSVSFTSVASDPNQCGDVIKLYICKDSNCTNCAPGGTSNCWTVSTSSSTTNPSASYSCPSCTNATNNYWAKVCDSADECSSIIPVEAQTFTCKKESGCACSCENGECAECFPGYCLNSSCSSGYKSSGWLESSTFNTGITVGYCLTGGVAYNSIMWQGTQPEGTSVKLQLATSNCDNGATNPPDCNEEVGWKFYGGDSCLTNDYYTAAPNIPVEIKCYSIHNNKCYFRYRVLLTPSPSKVYTPTVTKVIVNYSP